MRADAQRNRERLLDAAIGLILEVGGEPSRESLAQRAGVGIATLYRHFPDRQSLLHGVFRYALERSITAGERALADTTDSLSALRQYMHAAVDHGIGVVNLIHPLLDKAHPDLRTRAGKVLNAMIERGQHEGLLRKDASPADIVFATIRFSRPLAVGLSAADERAVAHRHIDIYVDGLRASTENETARKATRTSRRRAR